MIQIYQPEVADGWEWALPAHERDNLTLNEMFGKPLGEIWRPIEMKMVRRDELGRRWREADMPWMGEHLLVLRPRAVSVLKDLCLQSGELLSLACKDAELMAWNVTTVVDALDQKGSRICRFPSGRVMDIRNFRFKLEMVEGLVAFRIPELRTSIFVGGQFVQRVQAAGLTGTSFKLVS